MVQAVRRVFKEFDEGTKIPQSPKFQLENAFFENDWGSILKII